MKNIEFDTINGIVEVNDFSEDSDFCGCFSKHSATDDFRTWIDENFEGVRAMEVDELVFNMLDDIYGIKKI